MKNKNAVELSLNVIVIAAIVLVVLVVSIIIYTGFIGDEKKKLDEHIFNIGHDCDGDGLSDAIDPCPCDIENPDELTKTCRSVETCRNTITTKKCPTD